MKNEPTHVECFAACVGSISSYAYFLSYILFCSKNRFDFIRRREQDIIHSFSVCHRFDASYLYNVLLTALIRMACCGLGFNWFQQHILPGRHFDWIGFAFTAGHSVPMNWAKTITSIFWWEFNMNVRKVVSHVSNLRNCLIPSVTHAQSQDITAKWNNIILTKISFNHHKKTKFSTTFLISIHLPVWALCSKALVPGKCDVLELHHKNA